MILVIYGTRPEAIKLAPLVRELRSRKAHVYVVCTGQHVELLRGVDMVPDVDLRLMRDDHAPSEFVGRVLLALDVYLRESLAEWVVVQGDTSSAFAGALAAFHRGIKVAHVEAGLRTYDRAAPFPEEGYRQMIDRIADNLYAPTNTARSYLCDENVQGKIVVTGNTGVDAALHAISLGWGRCEWPTPFVLATMHRRESFGDPMRAICRALLRVVHARDLHVVLPVHPNPAVREVVEDILGHEPRVHLTAPLAYVDLLAAMQKCLCVVTDSGGIQEEAPTLGVPVLVTRETSERMEAVHAGNAILTGWNEDLIVREVLELHDNEAHRIRMGTPRPVFGDGQASKRIADDLLRET